MCIYTATETESMSLAPSVFPNKKQQIAVVYSESSQTSQMKCLTKKLKDFQPLTIFAKNFILDILQGSEYASGLLKLTSRSSKMVDTLEG